MRTATSTFTSKAFGIDIGLEEHASSNINCGEMEGRREDRRAAEPERLVLHWDRKLFLSPSDDAEERVAVLITWEDGLEFLLGVPASSDRLAQTWLQWS